MMLIDCHSHTELSGHGSGTLAQAVHAAEAKGLAVYAQTEHLVLPEHMDPDNETSIPADKLQFYIDELHRLQDELAMRGSQMKLICGIEADWLDGRATELEELCKPFSYVLGSVHFVDEMPIDDSGHPEAWQERGVDWVWERYIEMWIDMTESSAPITTCSHPDLPKKYGDFPSFSLEDAYCDMAEVAARAGRMVEVNTAGLRKAVGEMYPSLQFLKRFFAASVPCTVGCDAHNPDDIAANVEDAYALMYQAGYRELAVPQPDGDVRFVDLEV